MALNATVPINMVQVQLQWGSADDALLISVELCLFTPAASEDAQIKGTETGGSSDCD